MATIAQRSRWTPPTAVRWPQIASAVTCASNLDFATITEPKELAALRSEWTQLFDACGHPHQVFQTFEWLATWARVYLDARTQPAIVTGRRDGRLVLVWPLVTHRTFGFRILSGMGEPLSQYSDALIASDLAEADEDAALAHVMSLPCDVLALRRVRDDAAIAPLLRRRFGLSVNRQAAPYVDLAGVRDAQAFEMRFPGKLRSSRRRRRRRLEEQGPVSVLHHGASAEAAALVATALDFKRAWARRAGVLAPSLGDPRFERFFLAATTGIDAPDLRVSALRCGADVVGVSISVGCKGHLFGHVLAPHPERPGVGGILAETVIVGALEHGFSVFDTLAPADSYKREWTSTAVGLGDYGVPRSLAGTLYSRLWLRFGRDTVKTMMKRLRPIKAAIARRGAGKCTTGESDVASA